MPLQGPIEQPHGRVVIVCGGRDEEDAAFVFAALDASDAASRIGTVIEGGQRKWRRSRAVGGVDWHANRWAEARGRDWITVAADWTGLGRAAGPIRNGRMLKHNPDGVIAIRGGAGTADMIRQAERAGVPVERIT